MIAQTPEKYQENSVPDLDFLIPGSETKPEVEEAVEEENKRDEKLVVASSYKAEKRKKSGKYTDEEIEEFKKEIESYLDELYAKTERIGTIARSMYRRGVRVSAFEEDGWYPRIRDKFINFQNLFEKSETGVMTLLGSVNVSRLLEHIAVEFCNKHGIPYVPMTQKQRTEAHRISAMAYKISMNKNPVDYLGGYFYKILHAWRDTKKFVWGLFLKDEQIINWINADFDRRKTKKDVGHFRYDSDKGEEGFFKSTEPENKNDLLGQIARQSGYDAPQGF